MRAVFRTLMAVVLLTLGLALAGCDRSAAEAGGKRTIVVGLSNIGAESGWQRGFYNSVHQEAGKRGILLRYSDGQQKQENQIRAVRAFIAQQVDVIVLVPVVETGWEPVLREARDAGIPVLLVGRGIKVRDPDLYRTLIASDVVAEGRMAGEWLAKTTGGKAVIVELQGTPGASAALDRQKGFAEAIKPHPEMQIIRSESGNFERAKGKEVMEIFLKREMAAGKSRIQAVYAHNDEMALGAIQAIADAGLRPGKDILVIGVDGVREAFEAIVEEKMNCTVECTPLLGPVIYQAVEDVLAGKTPPRVIYSHDRLFDAANARQFLPERIYY